ncbi:hypothetical protein [Saccharothrix longispora]|uniref:hypothetical protein n=1 Tax=Saccharothrix longispora TaxID=33920 RepID=UPI0028FDAEB3|nr:hypothetical protein [Saccharothrix longispora]MDU0287679.1 hypothetical protein [Saccharothrix longispora]
MCSLPKDFTWPFAWRATSMVPLVLIRSTLTCGVVVLLAAGPASQGFCRESAVKITWR